MELSIQNLTRRYAKKEALKDVSLKLHSGDCYLLLGPNGSGKTTLMKMIASLVQPTSGQILLDGHSISVNDRARIAYMPTENFFYSFMTVQDAGKYYRDFFADFSYKAFEDRIERAELEMDKSIRALSSGMSAKLRLALILSRDAQLMMFDEPINGVDMLTRDWVLQEIAMMKNSERILLISTHLVEEASSLATGAIFLKKGEVIRAGETREVCAGKSLEDAYREVYGRSVEVGAC